MSFSYYEGFGKNWYRIIPSHYPPINIFEEYYLSNEDMEIAFYLEGLTNDRLKNEAGSLTLVEKEDWVYGSGASVVMAAFTHIGNPSRFTDGSYGVYYAGDSIEVSIAETMHHMRLRLIATKEASAEFTVRCYVDQIKKPFIDLFGREYLSLRTDDYKPSQQFAAKQKKEKAWGLYYPSVRHHNGACIAVLRPSAISLPVQNAHYRYLWNGEAQQFSGYFKIDITH